MSVLDDLKPLIRSRSVVCLGEFHGTQQFPQVVDDVVACAVAAGLSVTLGLEIPMSEHDNVAVALADPSTLVDGPWWRRSGDYLDGRTSAAMAALIASVGRQRLDGADIEVVAMDGPWVAPGSPIPMDLLHLIEQDRDLMMANRLLDIVDQRPRGFTLALAGSEHTRVIPPGQNSPRPMGSYLRAWHRDMVSLRGLSSGGTAWILRSNGQPAGSSEVAGVDLEPGAQWASTVGEDGHHGYLHVGGVTASPPRFGLV